MKASIRAIYKIRAAADKTTSPQPYFFKVSAEGFSFLSPRTFMVILLTIIIPTLELQFSYEGHKSCTFEEFINSK